MNPFAERRNRLRTQLGLTKQTPLLVTNLINVGYLTGFTGSSAWLIVTGDRELLISDSRYATQLIDECPDVECEIRDASSTQLETLARVIRTFKFNSLVYESESLTKSAFDQMKSTLASIELIDSKKAVEQLRSIKDESEIAAIRQSIRVNQQTMQVIRAQLRPEQTELEISHQLEHQMRLFGASGVAFTPSVAAGSRSALPHAQASNRQIGSESFLLIDWGAKVNRYASDLTRIFVTGKISPKLRNIYQIVLAAQTAAIAQIRSGVSLKTVDAAARAVIETAGFAKKFGHGTGHGFGLEIHETPFLSPIQDGSLVPGMVITIEPGIYLPDWGGVRIEDDILVTTDGCEVLSDLPRELEQCQIDFV